MCQIKKYYHSLSLFKKIFMPNIIGIILLFLTISLIYKNVLDIQNTQKNLQTKLSINLYIANENKILLGQISDLSSIIKATNEESLLKEIGEKFKSIRLNIYKMKKNNEDKKIEKLLNESIVLLSKYQVNIKIDTYEENSFFSKSTNKVYISLQEVNNNFSYIQESIKNKIDNEFNSILKIINNIIIYILILFIILVLVFGIFGYIINKDIHIRLKRLLSNISKITCSNTESIKKIDIMMEDEFGDIAKNINNVLENFEKNVNGLSKSIEYFENLSNVDSLTQIYNRRFVDDYLFNKQEEYLNNNKKYGIIMVDVDNFKSFNDTYGHAIGDLVLKEVAMVIKSNIRDSDIVGRFGGEEFIIITANNSNEGIFQLGEKLRNLIENLIIENNIKITSSFGCSIIKNNISIKELINEADKALYIAKDQGKNKVIVFNEEI